MSANGEPHATHVPVVTTIADDGSRICHFHLARPNPIVKILDGFTQALLVFTGPNTYISPDWYGTENQVPTWNYAAVQARGTPAILNDDDLAALLDALSAHNEAGLAPKKPWTSDKMDDALYARMRKAIVGYSMPVESLDAKFKMSQNRKPEERAGVKRALDALGAEQHTKVNDEIPD